MPAGAQYLYGEDPVALNVGRRTVRVRVSNTGDRAVQVGSHYHFFEANRELDFMRSEGYGMHLNIAAGTAVRFEPGDTRDVELCAYGGSEQLIGFSNLVDGRVAVPDTRRTALERAAASDFTGATPARREEDPR
jgi:urease subunit beta